MANVIKLKRGSGSDPSASDLVVGEVAIRTDSGKLFTKKDNGTIAEISGSGGGSDIFINTLSASSGSGGNVSGLFDNTATRFTLSNPPAVSAQQLLVSINGVIQKPNSGTSPSEGFAIDGNDIIFAAAPATGSDFFIVTYGSLNIAVPADNSVTSAKIVDGTIIGTDLATNIDLVDNQKIRFGTGNDLHIFHDGFNSYIDDNGTGELQFRTINGSNINLIGGSDFLAKFIKDGAVELYHDGSKKFETTSGGAKVTGFLNVTTGIHIPDGGNNDNSITMGSGNDFRLYHDGSSSRIIAANHDLIVQSNGYAIRSENGSSTFATIDSSGNVGIGTSPNYELQVNDPSGTVSVLQLTNTTTGSGAGDGFLVYNNGLNALISNEEAGDLRLQTSGLQRLTINSSGNVSIEGANDTTFDHVSVLTLKGTDAYNSGNAGSGITFGGKFNSSGNTTTLAQISGIKEDTGNGTYDGALTFGVRNDAEGVNIERMRIDSSGRVMIGVMDTSHASGNADDLCVGNNDSSAEHGITIGSNNAGSIRFSDSANGSVGIINYDHASDGLTFYTGASLRMSIDSAGETRLLAGVGTNKSTIELRNGSSSGTTNRLLYGLHSATTINNGTAIYSIFTNGTVGTPSDIRLKKNVETTRDGYLSDLANLRVVKYHWKTQEDTEPKELGLIAQEVEKIFPGLIHTEGEGSNEVKEIKRSVLPFMLLKALQEVVVRIEALEAG